jgi:hypothetical protein
VVAELGGSAISKAAIAEACYRSNAIEERN